jgi:DNA-binding winged helix-turn-helix (wHTH) protein/TolB-like protein
MTYTFGTFRFETESATLTRSDRLVPLERQPARALALLLARAGEVVTRDELRAHVWGEDTHVDFDRGLAYCIGQLRSALGDSADSPRFIQTLPRRGYTFIAPVRVDGDAAAATASAGADAAARPARISNWISAAAIAGVALVVGAAGALMIARDRPPSPPRRPIVAVAVFENETGIAAHDRAVAALSDAIVERLTAIGPAQIGVDSNAAILRRPRDARDWRAVARDTGAVYLVAGLLQTRADQLSLLMYLIRLDDGTHVWVQRISRPPDDRLDTLGADAASEIESAVRKALLR